MTVPDAQTGEDAASVELASRVVAAARGDETAFRALYEQHAYGVYNMVLRSVRDERAAEDLSQEIWMKAYRELPKLREPAAFGGWLYRIATKRCIDASRHRARRPVAESLADELADGRGDPETSLLHRESSGLTWEALAVLPPHQHLALFLKEVERRSYREIASILDISETAVGLCLLRARRSLSTNYERFAAADAGQRCRRLRATLAAVVDGEANEVQRRAVSAHVGGCRPCERDVARHTAVSRRYASLALVPVPALLSARILAHATAAAGVTAGTGGIAKLVLSTFTRAKPFAVALTVGGGLTAAALVAPRSTPQPAVRASAPNMVRPASIPLEAGVLDIPTAPQSAPIGRPSIDGAVPPLRMPSEVALPPFNQLLSPVANVSGTLTASAATAVSALQPPLLDLRTPELPAVIVAPTPEPLKLPQQIP